MRVRGLVDAAVADVVAVVAAVVVAVVAVAVAAVEIHNRNATRLNC